MSSRSTAETASEAGALAIAADEVDKILALDPEHIVARMIRMMDSLEDGRIQEAEDDLELVLDHPELIELPVRLPERIAFLTSAAKRFAQHGRIADALRIADRIISHGLQLNQPRGRSHYYQGRGPRHGRPIGPEQIPAAAKQLKYAFRANPRFREWYQATRSSIPSGPESMRSSICCPTRPGEY